MLRAWISLTIMLVGALALTWGASNLLEQRNQAQAQVKAASSAYTPPPEPRSGER